MTSLPAAGFANSYPGRMAGSQLAGIHCHRLGIEELNPAKSCLFFSVRAMLVQLREVPSAPGKLGFALERWADHSNCVCP